MSNSESTKAAIKKALEYLMGLSAEELREALDKNESSSGLTDADTMRYVKRIMGEKDGQEEQQ